MGKGGKGGRARSYSANDMRSMAKNPTSTHHKAATDNRANQLNPAHPAYGSSRKATTGGSGGGGFETEVGFEGGEDLVAREIRVNREAIDEGLDGGIIGQVELRLRDLSLEQLRDLVKAVVESVPGRRLVEGIAPEGMIAKELRDLVWRLILQDFNASTDGQIDVYLSDTWAQRFLGVTLSRHTDSDDEEEEFGDDL